MNLDCNEILEGKNVLNIIPVPLSFRFAVCMWSSSLFSLQSSLTAPALCRNVQYVSILSNSECLNFEYHLLRGKKAEIFVQAKFIEMYF